VHISYVKAVRLDSWSIAQLKIMASGGNTAFKEYLALFNIPESAPSDYKYKTKAAAYYREMLKQLSQNQNYDEPRPDANEGAEIFEF